MTSSRDASSSRGRLLMVEGVDGAGKSTLATPLAEALHSPEHPVIFLNKNTVDIDGDPELSVRLRRLHEVIYGKDRGDGQRWGDHHWLFLLAAWYSLVDETIIRPALAAGTNVVIDNGFYKILGRYRADDAFPSATTEQVFANLTLPDVVLLLDLAPARALARKGTFTGVESRYSQDGSDGFVRHQERVRSELRGLMTTSTWIFMDVTHMSPEQVLDEAVARVASHPLWSTPAAVSQT